MLSIQTANLPADQQQRLHSDFLANERDYLHMRDSLLPRYRGQWVAVHEGKVIAADPHLLAVTQAAAAAGGHPFIALVGAEEAVVFRVRRATFAYDSAYQPFPLPRVTATFWNHAETHSQTRADVIPTRVLIYQGKVEMDGRRFAALIQPVAGGQERIVGRDVLNQQRVLFDGPAEQVILDP